MDARCTFKLFGDGGYNDGRGKHFKDCGQMVDVQTIRRLLASVDVSAMADVEPLGC